LTRADYAVQFRYLRLSAPSSGELAAGTVHCGGRLGGDRSGFRSAGRAIFSAVLDSQHWQW
jgi:hypothetical protein